MEANGGQFGLSNAVRWFFVVRRDESPFEGQCAAPCGRGLSVKGYTYRRSLTAAPGWPRA